jgi:hypothetical protein
MLDDGIHYLQKQDEGNNWAIVAKYAAENGEAYWT